MLNLNLSSQSSSCVRAPVLHFVQTATKKLDGDANSLNKYKQNRYSTLNLLLLLLLSIIYQLHEANHGKLLLLQFISIFVVAQMWYNLQERKKGGGGRE